MEFNWKSFEEELNKEFSKVTEKLEENFKKLYVSRVHPDLVSGVLVKAYDSNMKLEELANITIPSARTIHIKPFDTNTIDEIVKGIQKQKPEFSPIVQADHLKIVLNPPTEESRKKAVKEAKELLEQSKVVVRNIRKNFISKLKTMELTEDQEKKHINQTDIEIKNMNSKLEASFASKEKELMTL